MKLWQKSGTLNQQIEQFTIGKDQEFDLELAPYDILGSMAHAKMLAHIGLLTEEEEALLHQELQVLYEQAKNGEFQIEVGVEDVHSQVEFLLTQKLGDIGKKLHSGRSRNDQVLVDLRLFFRAKLEAIAEEMKGLFECLLEQSEKHKNVLMPGYTHMQVAMVSSFGLWFGAYAESLVDDLQQLAATYQIVNQNPLGSGAGYGSSFPLDRQLTTELLGFADLNYNVVHAQLGRGKTELFMSFALAGLGHTLGKLAMDCCLFSSQNYQFFQLPDSMTTGSSIMPHKKNPDVFELIRARCNQLQSLPQQVSLMTSNLPSGYHRDFQLLKEVLFPAIQQTLDILSILTSTMSQLQINPAILDDPKYDYLYTVEVVNEQVLNGVPFRDAYHAVGQAVEAGTFEPQKDIRHTHAGSLGNLCHAEVREKWRRGIVLGFGKIV